MLVHLIKVPYFVYSLRLFSCDLRILFRQRNEDRSVAHHVWVVLHYNAVSEYHVAVAVATAVTALDVVQHCNILLRECLPPPPNIQGKTNNVKIWKYYLGTHTIVAPPPEVRLLGSLWSWGWRVSSVNPGLYHLHVNSVHCCFMQPIQNFSLTL